MTTNALTMKTNVLQILDELPAERVAEVLDFALFLSRRRQNAVASASTPTLPTIPAAHVMPLVGLVAWGGDAVTDTERLYES